jgi:hypothetical protein
VKKVGNGKISKPCLKLMLYHGDIMMTWISFHERLGKADDV